MTLSVKIFNHADGGTTFAGERVLDGNPITIGRGSACTLKLDDPEKQLSRVHVELTPARGGYLLKVVSQYFSVLVNGGTRGPGSEVMLHAGDSVVLDVYELEIVSVGAENAAGPEAAPIRTSAPAPAAPAATQASHPAPVAPRAPAVRPAMPSGLSATRLADLPGADPFQTGMGGQGTAVQIASLQVGHVLAGRFRVDEQIGAGGMGAVYRAHDALRGEDIALKVMLPGLLASEQAKQRFMNEAKIALRLRHPGIVSVYDVQSDGAYLFLTMELLKGRTLRDEMEERKASSRTWAEAEVLAIIRPVCEALTYAHQYTIHRDVKPENVWLNEDGSIKLMDFGIARVLSGSQMTQTSAVMGTAYYMAPEQLVGARDVDHRADQYALGVMLYEMLTGRIPAGRIEPLSVARPDLSYSLALTADKALSGRVEGRFATDTELMAALNAPPGAVVAPLKDFGRRAGLSPARMKLVGMGAAAIAGVLLLALLWPALKGLMPDHEAERKAEQEVARLDGEAKSLLKLLENDRRELKESATATSREVERLENQVRSAKSAQERAVLEVPLREARDKASISGELDRKLRERAEGPNGVPKAEGSLNAAAAALKGKDRTEAVRLLNETVAALHAIRNVTGEERKAALAQEQKLTEQRKSEERQVVEANTKAEAETKAKAQAQAQAASAAHARDEAAKQARSATDSRIKAALDFQSKADSEMRTKLDNDMKARQAADGKSKGDTSSRPKGSGPEKAMAGNTARDGGGQDKPKSDSMLRLFQQLAR